MSGKKVRLGFVGTGGIAKWHLKNLQAVPEAAVVALCDLDEARAKTAAAPFGAQVFTDWAPMLKEVALDGLFVCVPPHAHGEVEIRAAEQGIHLMVEKPINRTYAKAREVCQAIQKAGVMSQAGYRRRYEPSSRQLKEFLTGRTVGAAQVIRWGDVPPMPWWSSYEKSGGQLVEQTTHQVDLLRWVMGEVRAVAASYSFNRLFKGRPGVDVPDSQSALLIFESGASATISTACATDKGGKMETDFVIDGARVSYSFEKLEVVPAEAYALPAPPPKVNIDQAFVQALASKDPAFLLSPYEDALKSLAVTLAANRSAEQGGRLVPVREIVGE